MPNERAKREQRTREIAEQVIRDSELPPPGPNRKWETDDASFITRLRKTLLPDIDPTMSRVIVQDPKRRPTRGNVFGGFTDVLHNDPHIYINSFTDTYKAAKRGDEEAQRKLAAQLAHENAHIYSKHPPLTPEDEGAAYEAQIDRLRKLGASDKTIKEVEQIRDSVVRRK